MEVIKEVPESEEDNNSTTSNCHFIISSNGLKIPFNGYTYDPYFADNLEAILNELSRLKLAEPPLSDINTLPNQKPEHKSHLSTAENITNDENIELNITQLVYQFLSCIIVLAYTILTPTKLDEQAQMGFTKTKLQTLANIFVLYVQDTATAEHKAQSDEPPLLLAFSPSFLFIFFLRAQHTNIFFQLIRLRNTISIATRLKSLFSALTRSHQEDPSIINTYISYIGIPLKFKIFMLLTMNALTSNLFSFFLGSFFLSVTTIAFISSLPFIAMFISTILFTSFSLSAINIVYKRVNCIIHEYIPIRDILTFFADRIPPSVGRVEVSHQKQRQDYEASLKAKNSLPNGKN